jgi:hypothetical protein
LAPWLSLISIILTCGSRACWAKRSALKLPSGVAAAEVARADLPDQVAAVLAVVAADAALAGVVREAADPGALVERQMALADSAPKLIAEMLNTLAL